MLLKDTKRNVHSPALVLSPGTALILSTIRGWHLLRSSSVMLDDMWCEPSMLLERCRGVLMALLLGYDCGGNLSGGRQ